QRKNLLEEHMVNLLPAFYQGTLTYFKTDMDVEVKDLTYMDDYGILRLAFNTVNIEDKVKDKSKQLTIEDIIDYETRNSVKSDNVIRGVFIYKVDSSDETIIPIMDSTRIILSKIMEDVNLTSLSNMNVEKIGNINEIKDLFQELMDENLSYKSFKLETIGLYGHYHESTGFKINIDLDYFDQNDFDNIIVSNEKQLWENGLLELEEDAFLNRLKNSQLDLFYLQMRDLYDSLINDDFISKSIPLRRFIFHFSYNNQEYAVVEVSRKVQINKDNNHNRLGVICRLGDKGLNLSSLIKKTEEALKRFESGEDVQDIKIRFQTSKLPLSII
ncbi:MAG: hypothetical protein JW791_00370, partial [Nanoarchaeota archaeon]|nr:hypothetical protein [Nanoarchaeota archaeon]